VETGGNDPGNLGSNVCWDGKEATGLPVVEAESFFFEFFADAQRHDIIELKKWRYDASESPKFEHPTDFTFDIGDLVGRFRKKIADSLGQRRFYV
jgi:hypothetical protein